MNRYYRKILGNTIRKVLDIDVDTNDMDWGSFILVRVDLNLYKPLVRGRTILVLEEDLWMPVKYEKLSKFCFGRGRILHEEGDCPLKEAPSADQYGV